MQRKDADGHYGRNHTRRAGRHKSFSAATKIMETPEKFATDRRVGHLTRLAIVRLGGEDMQSCVYTSPCLRTDQMSSFSMVQEGVFYCLDFCTEMLGKYAFNT